MYEDLASDEFNIGDEVFVLTYTYPLGSNYTFIEAIGAISDEFNYWYALNSKYLQDWIDTKDNHVKDNMMSLGDVTNKVNRTLRIDDILSEDFDF